MGNGRERKRERAGRSEEVSRRSCLPSVSSLRRPMEQEEALQMLSLAEKLIEYSLDFLEPKISPQEHSVLKITTSLFPASSVLFGKCSAKNVVHSKNTEKTAY